MSVEVPPGAAAATADPAAAAAGCEEAAVDSSAAADAMDNGTKKLSKGQAGKDSRPPPNGSGSEPSLLALDLPVTGNLEGMEVLPSAEELRALLLRAMAVASTLAATRPGVQNLDKLARRIRSDLEFVRRCCPVGPPVGSAGNDPSLAQPLETPQEVVVAAAGSQETATATAAAAFTTSTAAAAATTAIHVAAGTEAAEAEAAAAAIGVSPAAGVVAVAEAPAKAAADASEAAAAAATAAESAVVAAATVAEAEAAIDGGGRVGLGDGGAGGGREAGGAAGALLPLTPGRVQGIINNLRGFQGELLAAQLAPDVVAVSRRFQARVPLPPETRAAPAAGLAAAAPTAHTAHTATTTVTASAPVAASVDDAVTGCSVGLCTAAVAVVVTDNGAVVAGGDVAAGGASSTATAAAEAGPVTVAAAAVVGQKRPLVELVTSAEVAGPTAVAAAAPSTDHASNSDSANGRGAGGGGGGGVGGSKGAGRRTRAGDTGGAGSATGSSVVSVEVDVVAQEGHCWIEVKNQEVFGLESVHWTGAARHIKGLRRQAVELLAVAAAEEHHRRWRPPTVVMFFPSGAVHPDVRRELEALGAHVAVGPGSLRHLPPPPRVPDVTNLDVTTMCGLVSELSHGGAYDSAVEQWAQRTVHWVDCLAAERAAPLLEQLTPWLAPGRQLVAADLACRQFQVLLDMFGGPRERERWAALQSRMTVVATEGRPEELSPRCRALLGAHLGRDQLAVFGLGDLRRAITLTANGNAVRGAERRGVVLEVVLHRPVWLTGR